MYSKGMKLVTPHSNCNFLCNAATQIPNLIMTGSNNENRARFREELLVTKRGGAKMASVSLQKARIPYADLIGQDIGLL